MQKLTHAKWRKIFLAYLRFTPEVEVRRDDENDDKNDDERTVRSEERDNEEDNHDNNYNDKEDGDDDKNTTNSQKHVSFPFDPSPTST